MDISERLPLIGGPYSSPQLEVGEIEWCTIGGRVEVVGWSQAPISWPMREIPGRRRTPILCGELLRAVRTESNASVAYWWGVNTTTVSNWRKALGVPRFNAGSQRLLTAPPSGLCRPWTTEEDDLLGTQTDKEISILLKRGLSQVTMRRHKLGIPAFDAKKSYIDQDSAKFTVLQNSTLKQIRLSMNLYQRQVAKRAGINQATYSHLETGHRTRVTKVTLEKLAAALEINAEDLLLK